MKPSDNLKNIIDIISRSEPEQNHTLEDISLQARDIGATDLKLAPNQLSDLRLELSNLQAIYGADAGAGSLAKGEIKELSLWAASAGHKPVEIVHAVNFEEKAFSDRAYIVELPFGNFSSSYLVYADNAQDALDALADHEIERRESNPDIRIFKVDENDHTADELQSMEDHGEVSRLGNNSQLFDTSNVSIRQARSLSLEKGVDIDEWIKSSRKPEGQSLSR
ncbi:hypothetical protein RYA05_00160 [Pseudomonas syringae pv. actinidiae]|nr:hypothetical protein [Pseudomonas syringae pv. actinidiae]